MQTPQSDSENRGYGNSSSLCACWLQIILYNQFSCQDKKISRWLLRGAQHLAGSAPMETGTSPSFGSRVLTCQLFGFGTENRVKLMLSGRSPWVILTAVESALLLLPDNQRSLFSFFSPALLERKHQRCFPSGCLAGDSAQHSLAEQRSSQADLQRGLQTHVFPK